MKSTKIFICSLLVITACLATACSSDSGTKKKAAPATHTEETEATSGKPGAETTAFAVKVMKVCNNIDQSIFTQLSSPSVIADPTTYSTVLSAAEDELDKAIASFGDINPPAKYSDDWDTFQDDFSAIRDAFPKLSDDIKEIAALTATMTTENDAATQTELQAKLSKLEKHFGSIGQDLSQRSKRDCQHSEEAGIR